jgi:hypothetical protein
MIRESFTSGWTVRRRPGLFGTLGAPAEPPLEIALPHDAVRDLPRDPDGAEGGATGYHPGGAFTYEKTFDVPEAWRERVVTLEFEGVYRDAVVLINGDFAAQRPNGYAGFAVRADPFLRYGQPNTVTVEARAHLDSRWYTGAGIYRPVHLLVADPVHVALDGVRVVTRDVDAERAVVEVGARLENETRTAATVRLSTRVLDADGAVVAESTVPVTVLPGEPATARLRLPVPAPRLWSPDSPDLYRLETTIARGADVLDTESTTFGIRTLQLDAEHGLRLNGEPVLLRGACVHHDNGPLGAVSVARAEERRIALLKGAGFNAVRSAHNPLARSALDACDRLGVLVMDELTDVWTKGKTDFDAALTFAEWWERDVEAMVAKDANHPSVVLYSIGNEVFEAGSGIGSAWGRRLAEKIRELDPTRYVTNGINAMVATADKLAAMAPPGGGTTDVNAAMASMGDMLAALATSDLVTDAIEESAGVLDVLGLNYGDARYALEAERYTHRVVVGSETFPSHIDALWEAVTRHGHVIGDFTWTGWDYLGESGIGRVSYVEDGDGPAMSGPYPYLTAHAGDLDITGVRRTISYYREIVFGLRREPYLAVHRPQHHGKTPGSTPWGWSDSAASWTWDVPAGSPVTVDVYTPDAQVELVVNGRSVGTAQVGEVKPFLARFETVYEPGDVVAVTTAPDGTTRRARLRTADAELRLVATAERPAVRAADDDLAYVALALADEHGTVPTDRDVPVTVEVEGPGRLVALGTGNPSTAERFDAATCTTYEGRALAVVRPTGPGEIVVRVSTPGLADGDARVVSG